MSVVTRLAVFLTCLLLGRFAAGDEPAWRPLLQAAEQALAAGDTAAAERAWLAAEQEIRAANDRRALARVDFELGTLYARTGRPSDAVARFETALGLYEAIAGPRHPDTLAALANLAAAQRDVGNKAEARRLAERVQKSLDGRGLPPDATLAQTLNTLGNVAMESGDYARAVALYQRVVKIQNEEYRASEAEKRAVLENLAQAQERAGDARGAKGTLARLERASSGGAARAELLERSAEQQRKSGEIDAARASLRQAASLRDQAGEDAAAALDHVLLAELERALGDADAAERELGLALASRACPVDAVARAGEIAGALAAQQAKVAPDAARRLYGKSAEALARGRGAEHASVASAAFNLGVLAYEAGDDSEARREFARALAIWKKSLPASDPKLAQLEGLIAELDQNDRADAGEIPDVGAGGAD